MGENKARYADIFYNEGMFNSQVRRLKKFKATFKLRVTGITSEARVIGHKYIYKDHSDYAGRGVHLSMLVLNEVKKRVKSGEYVPVNTDNNRDRISTIMYDPFNIHSSIGSDDCYALDINYCYWNVAHNLGIISDHIFDLGLKKDREWKSARNIAIGSLGARYYEELWVAGKKKYGEHFRRPYNVVRLDVIDYVWDIANIISYDIKDSFLFFLTDCFFVRGDSARDMIIEKLKGFNLECKVEKVTIKHINADHGKKDKVDSIKWIKESSQGESPHSFNNKNIVSWKQHLILENLL